MDNAIIEKDDEYRLNLNKPPFHFDHEGIRLQNERLEKIRNSKKVKKTVSKEAPKVAQTVDNGKCNCKSLSNKKHSFCSKNCNCSMFGNKCSLSCRCKGVCSNGKSIPEELFFKVWRNIFLRDQITGKENVQIIRERDKFKKDLVDTLIRYNIGYNQIDVDQYTKIYGCEHKSKIVNLENALEEYFWFERQRREREFKKHYKVYCLNNNNNKTSSGFGDYNYPTLFRGPNSVIIKVFINAMSPEDKLKLPTIEELMIKEYQSVQIVIETLKSLFQQEGLEFRTDSKYIKTFITSGIVDTSKLISNEIQYQSNIKRAKLTSELLSMGINSFRYQQEIEQYSNTFRSIDIIENNVWSFNRIIEEERKFNYNQVERQNRLNLIMNKLKENDIIYRANSEIIINYINNIPPFPKTTNITITTPRIVHPNVFSFLNNNQNQNTIPPPPPPPPIIDTTPPTIITTNTTTFTTPITTTTTTTIITTTETIKNIVTTSISKDDNQDLVKVPFIDEPSIEQVLESEKQCIEILKENVIQLFEIQGLQFNKQSINFINFIKATVDNGNSNINELYKSLIDLETKIQSIEKKENLENSYINYGIEHVLFKKERDNYINIFKPDEIKSKNVLSLDQLIEKELKAKQKYQSLIKEFNENKIKIRKDLLKTKSIKLYLKKDGDGGEGIPTKEEIIQFEIEYSNRKKLLKSRLNQYGLYRKGSLSSIDAKCNYGDEKDDDIFNYLYDEQDCLSLDEIVNQEVNRWMYDIREVAKSSRRSFIRNSIINSIDAESIDQYLYGEEIVINPLIIKFINAELPNSEWQLRNLQEIVEYQIKFTNDKIDEKYNYYLEYGSSDDDDDDDYFS